MKYHRLSCEMSFFNYYVVFLVLFQLQGIRSQETGDCYIQKFPSWDDDRAYTLYDISDKVPKTAAFGEVIFNSTYNNIKDIKIDTKSKTYFSMSFDDSKTLLIMSVNEGLSTIDQDYPHLSQSTISTQTKIEFTCQNNQTRNAQITVIVEDRNVNPPEFSSSSYQFSLPMPMPSKIPLTMFGSNPITVRDKDFSTSNITFTSDYTDLLFETTYNKNDEKNGYPYVMEMKFNSFTRLLSNKSFTIYATDDGYPESKTSTVAVTFLIDHQESEYSVTFKQPSFLYEYQEDEGTISAENGEVKIIDPRNNIACEIIQSYQKYFQEPVVNGDTVQLQLKEKLPESLVSQKTLRVTLTCGIPNNVKSSADILISMPEFSALFSESSYNAKYIIEDGVHRIEMNDIIEITGNTNEIVIEVENDYQSFFQVEKDGEDSNQWILKKKNDLTKDFLDNLSLNIVIDIKSHGTTITDKAVITLLLPNSETGVKFTNSYVTGDYVVDENGKGQLTSDIKIELNSEYVKVKGQQLLGEYSNFFNFDYVEPSTFTVTSNGDLPKEALKSNTIFLTIHADLDLGTFIQAAEATFVVQLSNSVSTTEPSTTTTTTQEPTTQSPSTTTTHTTTPTTSKSTEPTTQSPSTATTSKTHSTDNPTESPITSTTKKAESTDDCDYTVWLVVTIILALILVLYIGASLLYYFKKMRNSKNDHEFPSELPEKTTRTTEVEEHFQKKTSHIKPLKDISTRRATGFIRFSPDLDQDNDAENSDNSETQDNTKANRRATPPPPPMPATNDSKNNAKDEKPTEFHETLADALKKAVLERESRLI